MTSFSAAWLDLREPADHAARSQNVLGTVAAAFAGRESLSIVDLACGTGSTVRGCALALPAARQRWTLVDHDPRLLDAARRRMVAWADSVDGQADGITVTKAGTTIVLDFRQADLTSGIESSIGDDVDLLTASALFDLVSQPWITRLVAAASVRALPLYAALSYDGHEHWLPPHPDDEAVHRAFLAHQRRDKGFGGAVGPDAGQCLIDTLSRAGYRVTAGESPWRLEAVDAELVTQIAAGIGVAAAESGGVSQAAATAWSRFRRDSARATDARTTIGHVDICAFPSAGFPRRDR